MDFSRKINELVINYYLKLKYQKNIMKNFFRQFTLRKRMIIINYLKLRYQKQYYVENFSRMDCSKKMNEYNLNLKHQKQQDVEIFQKILLLENE